MKELEPKTERELPSNITVAWGRSSVAYGEITYRTSDSGKVRLGRIMRDSVGQFDDIEWMELLGECIFQAKEHPDWQFHLVRLDHEKFVPQNPNNQPYSQANNWTKHMNMFGFSYESKV